MARFINPPGSGGSADIADFVFTDEGEEDGSSIAISNKDLIIRTTRDDSETDADISLESADDVFIEAQGDDVSINGNNNVRINAYNENVEVGAAGYTIFTNGDVYIGSDDAEDQVATLGDIGIETPYSVEGGTSGTQPTFNGDPLFSASYVRMSSNLVHFQIQVDMDNITNFGTGQYYMTLPFPSKYGYMFRESCLHDISANREYHISGHVFAGSNQMTLFTSDTQGNNLYDFPFAQGEPVTLTTADNFHIAGTYIAEDLS